MHERGRAPIRICHRSDVSCYECQHDAVSRTSPRLEQGSHRWPERARTSSRLIQCWPNFADQYFDWLSDHSVAGEALDPARSWRQRSRKNRCLKSMPQIVFAYEQGWFSSLKGLIVSPVSPFSFLSFFHRGPLCPSSYKMGHQSGLSIGGSGSFV